MGKEKRAVTGKEMEDLRVRVGEIFSDLKDELKTSKKSCHISWLNGAMSSEDISDRCHYLDQYGFLRIPKFSCPNEVVAMKQQMKTLCEEWDPSKEVITFSTEVDGNLNQGSKDYFLESASRVHFFAESSALKEDGSLKEQYLTDKVAALNKSGHAMHIIPGSFRDYTLSSKVKYLVSELGWKDPVVPQSMYICKNPEIGGAVNSHQDSTFLFTEPRQSCLGLWLALDDATLINGCLWVRPKSHMEPVRRQFKRNEEHFTTEVIEDRSNIPKGDVDKPKMIFDIVNESKIEWEGGIPENSEPPYEGLLDAGFIPVECKAGDLLAFVGELDHLSLPNYSKKKRHTFQLHLVEGPGAGVEWSKSNWLQYPKGVNFLSIRNEERKIMYE